VKRQLMKTRIYPNTAHTPTMYGLPTTTDISSAGCFSYDCAKWLCDSLSEFRQHETCVKDTLTILSLLQNKFFIWKDYDVL